MLNKLLALTLAFAVVFSTQINIVFASEHNLVERFIKAEVTQITEDGVHQFESFGEIYSNPFQEIQVKILEGEDVGKLIKLEYSGISETSFQRVSVGQGVVLSQHTGEGGSVEYQLVDRLRTTELIGITIIFLILVFALSKWKGLGSLLGMIFSLYVILRFIIPLILAGKDPLIVSILGSVAILITSIYLAHGFSRQTTVAVVATSLTLIITGWLSYIFVNITNLSGISNEDTASLLFGGPTATINYKGLLLGGMIIGFLGVLDDITTSLSATVFELKKVNPKLTFSKLINSSLNVGVEHISSLVNTLVLAYAGASLPIFLYLVLNQQGYPVWYMLNSEFIAEEIVRTLTGSIGLLLAVPITTIMASYVVTRDHYGKNKR